MIARDKVLHFGVGAGLFMAGELLNQLLHAPDGMIGLGLVIIAAAVKEGRDSLGYGTPEWLDFYATLAGGLLALVVTEAFLGK